MWRQSNDVISTKKVKLEDFVQVKAEVLLYGGVKNCVMECEVDAQIEILKNCHRCDSSNGYPNYFPNYAYFQADMSDDEE